MLSCESGYASSPFPSKLQERYVLIDLLLFIYSILTTAYKKKYYVSILPTIMYSLL